MVEAGKGVGVDSSQDTNHLFSTLLFGFPGAVFLDVTGYVEPDHWCDEEMVQNVWVHDFYADTVRASKRAHPGFDVCS